MNRLMLLGATFVLAAGVMQAQSSPTATDTGRPNATPDQTQRGNPATSPIVPHQRPQTPANPDRPEAMPQTTLPNTTVEDQLPGNSTNGSPASTMGTTGSTPGTEQNPEGNKQGTTPSGTQQPETKPAQPHASPSGSSNPNSSANGAGSDDMSGANPKAENPKATTKPDKPTNTTNPQTTSPHVATHAPDAGTVMNPASVELVVEARR